MISLPQRYWSVSRASAVGRGVCGTTLSRLLRRSRPVDLVRAVTKNGTVFDVVDVIIFDDTYDARLALLGRVATSAAYWKTSNTVLLLSNPGLRSDKRPTLSITQNTYVDVDPYMTDAEWLRAFAQRLTTKEPVNVPFPEGGMMRIATPVPRIC